MFRFFPLEIQGARTARVEALGSFLVRLARIHAVGSGALLAAAMERFPDADSLSLRGALQAPLSALIRPNRTTSMAVRALAAALQCDAATLEPMTFLALESALDRPLKTFAAHFRWCPACLHEQIKAGEEAYYALQWQVVTVERCDIHTVRLRDRCAQCGATQESYGPRDSLARCIRCAQPLDVVLPSDLTDTPVNADISALVAQIARNPGMRFPARGISRLVGALLDEAWHLESEMTLFKAIPRDECVRFANPDEPVTLQSAMRVAFRLGVPLVDVLNGECIGTNRALFTSAQRPLPKAIAPAPRRHLANFDNLQERLREARIFNAKTELPPSLRDVARRVGISVGALRYRYPAEADAIVDAYIAAKRRQRRRTLSRCQSTVRIKVERWGALESAPLSRKAVLASLRRSTDLPKNLLRTEIAQAFLTQPPRADRRSP